MLCFMLAVAQQSSKVCSARFTGYGPSTHSTVIYQLISSLLSIRHFRVPAISRRYFHMHTHLDTIAVFCCTNLIIVLYSVVIVVHWFRGIRLLLLPTPHTCWVVLLTFHKPVFLGDEGSIPASRDPGNWWLLFNTIWCPVFSSFALKSAVSIHPCCWLYFGLAMWKYLWSYVSSLEINQ